MRLWERRRRPPETSVWVVVREVRDCRDHVIEVRAVCATRIGAERVRAEALAQGPPTSLRRYALQD